MRTIGPRNQKLTANVSLEEKQALHELHETVCPHLTFATFHYRIILAALRENGKNIPIAPVTSAEVPAVGNDSLAVAMAFIASFIPSAHLTYENALDVARKLLMSASTREATR